MRLLSSEAKNWKSRVVTEAEEVLCRESAQAAQQATEAQEAMDQHYKAKWRQAEADLQALCQSNSAQVQSLAAKLQETNLEHHELYTAQERQLRLEAQTLRQAQEQEQQAAQITKNMNLQFKSFDDKPKSSQNFTKHCGDVTFLRSLHTRQRSMSSILRCSICERSLRCSRSCQHTCASSNIPFQVEA